MAKWGDRFMYLMVFFDLPTTTKAHKKAAAKFRHFLLKDGYIMLQWSVYIRISKGQDMIDKHMRRVQLALPSEGSIRALQITDRQYARMKLLLGVEKKEEILGSEQLILL